MLEFMSCYMYLDNDAPISEYPDGQSWRVWTSAQASTAWAEFVAQQGLNPEECTRAIPEGQEVSPVWRQRSFRRHRAVVSEVEI